MQYYAILTNRFKVTYPSRVHLYTHTSQVLTLVPRYLELSHTSLNVFKRWLCCFSANLDYEVKCIKVNTKHEFGIVTCPQAGVKNVKFEVDDWSLCFAVRSGLHTTYSPNAGGIFLRKSKQLLYIICGNLALIHQRFRNVVIPTCTCMFCKVKKVHVIV